MSGLQQFLQKHNRRQLPSGPDGSSEIVIYEEIESGDAVARTKSSSSLTLVNVGLTLINVAIFAQFMLS